MKSHYLQCAVPVSPAAQAIIPTLDRIDLILVSLPFVKPFATSVHTWAVKEALLLRLESGGVVGWGECVADPDPFYASETTHTVRHVFKDFLLPRILDVGAKGEPGEAGERDWLWNNYFDVAIGPHPALTASQKKVVAKDYGLDHGNGVLTVRYAMLFYVLKRLGLLGDAAKQSAHTQHIVTINRKETEAALERAELQL